MFLPVKIKEKKNGAPSNEVTIPVGSSAGEIIVREKVSLKSKRIAPKIMEIKISLFPFVPKNFLTM